MKRANWLIMFLVGFAVAVPAYAAELSLGGFPSYMRTRARFIDGATYRSASANNNGSENVAFADTTLRLTPQLSLTDSVTLRAQIDVFDNNIWGGQTDQLLGGGSTLVNSSISPSDKFRGSILHGNGSENCLNFGVFCAVEQDAGFFNVRMLHADIVLPNDLGFVRIGRQPFDWGMGILANGGWDPSSDGGFLVDRFLWLKTFSAGEESTLTTIFVSDRITQGTGLQTGGGDGWDGGAVALVFNHPNAGGVNFTLGGYVFPYIHQDDFLGEQFSLPPGTGFGDLDRYTLYSGLIDLKTDAWKFTGELQGGFGELRNVGGNKVDIKNALLWAFRAEYLAPTIDYLNVAGAEFGWADGDENDGAWTDGQDIEGGVIVFSPAYNIDSLLFKHVMPSIYQDAHGNILVKTDASVQNAYYARLYASVPVVSRVTFSPQILVGWNNETDSLIRDGAVIGTLPDADADGNREPYVASQPKKTAGSYIGTEFEGTFTVEIHPGVNLDIIGSLILAGEGLTDLLEAQAFARDNDVAGTTEFADEAEAAAAFAESGVFGQEADDIIWGVQTKLTIFIDEFFKS